MKKPMQHIVIVGGGAGGLELATKLGKKLGKSNKAKITLIDCNATHIWKPLLHEVAAGTLDAGQDEINYYVHASTHHYYFQLGRMTHLNRQKKEIILAPIFNNGNEEIIPQRIVNYDILVLAFGSITNDLNIKGVKENTLYLDTAHEANRFQQLFLKYLLRMQNDLQFHSDNKLNIVIVGAGATGVELAAELHYTINEAKVYGLDKINPERDIRITLIEASERILPMLPDRISSATLEELERLKIKVLTNERVSEVQHDLIITADGKEIPTTMTVWTAGIKVADFAKSLDGLEINKLNQIVVKPTLQTTRDDHVFALGDCASCIPINQELPVAPRAQAAHQQALMLAKSLALYLKHQPLLQFTYHDYGSLISLSRYDTVGNLMGKLTGTILLEGRVARWVYLSLYKKHQTAILGFWRVVLLTIANLLTKRVKPRLKLH